MLDLFSFVIEVLAGIVTVTAAAIVIVRIRRRIRHRRRSALAAGPRRALLAFVADNGEHGSHDLVAIPDDAWRAVEPGALALLGNLELRQAVPDLCRLLTDRHAEVRIVAVRALGRIGDPAAAWRLIASLDRHDPIPSLLATHTLVQLGPEAEVTLSAALDHPRA